MKNIIDFIIDKDQKISVETKSEEKVSAFTKLSIKFLKSNGLEVILYFQDFLCDGIVSFLNILKRARNLQLNINNELKKQGIGYWLNQYLFYLYEKDDYDVEDLTENFLVWSTPSKIGVNSWLYNDSSKFFFEVTPFYDFDSNGTKTLTFQNFIENYKPIIRIELNLEIIEKWYDQSKELLKQANYYPPPVCGS